MKIRSESGFTLLELTVAIAVITLGLIALLAVLPGTMNVTRNSRETQIATSALRSKLDEMKAAPFYDKTNPSDPNSIFNLYNNATFTAAGLLNAQGTIRFMTELETATIFATKVDLDLDNAYNETTNATAEFQAYPTQLRLVWTDLGNQPRAVSLTTIIYNHNQ